MTLFSARSAPSSVSSASISRATLTKRLWRSASVSLGLRSGLCVIVGPYWATFPFIHCGLEAFPHQVNVVGNGIRWNLNRKKSASYASAILIVASSTLIFSSVCTNLEFWPTMEQSIFSDYPAAISLRDPWIISLFSILLLFPHFIWSAWHDQRTFRIAKMWLLFVIVKGNAKAKVGSEAEALNVASAS
jgi:hypothetical protein